MKDPKSSILGKAGCELPDPLIFQKIKKPPKNRRLKSGAGEEGRTPDLMLGKHTL